ncbi:MAG TPA: NAD-dependent epimerase/dehydratase family protein [Gemmatimonadaceae bacterium]|nr:NAD-dependent epimerase/dehydratase family protein [Gemmatimonadaceae bacterium]
MADVLILGGTRNLGHVTALALLEAGHEVSVLNRGMTPDELPPAVRRLRGDRTDSVAMRRAVPDRDFDLVLDTTTYTGADARSAIEVFGGRVGRYVFISTGQVYLVREGISRPFREDSYDGPVMAELPRHSDDYDAWAYGAWKRDAEDEFSAAFSREGFPLTTLRLPMVASERDHYGRIQAYVARLLDGHTILVPDETGLPLRHVYVGDVARIIVQLVASREGTGRAYNISYGESMSLADFLATLAVFVDRTLDVQRVPRAELTRAGLLPHCSPFSGRWMSELDNTRSLAELGGDRMSYTSPEGYLPSIIEDYQKRWQSNGIIPLGYDQRLREKEFAY